MKMRERMYRAAAIVFYLAALGYLTGFSPRSMLDARGLAAVVLGMALLSLPGLYGLARGKRERISEIGNWIAHNGMVSGYLTTVLFLVAHLSNTGQADAVPKLLGEDLRPVLYGLCLYTIFHAREDDEGQQTGADGAASGACREVSAEKLYVYYKKQGLTNRETELAILAYRGYSNREIAEECYISEATVKKHMTHIFEKLGVEGREQLRNRGAEDESRQKGNEKAGG